MGVSYQPLKWTWRRCQTRGAPVATDPLAGSSALVRCPTAMVRRLTSMTGMFLRVLPKVAW